MFTLKILISEKVATATFDIISRKLTLFISFILFSNSIFIPKSGSLMEDEFVELDRIT